MFQNSKEVTMQSSVIFEGIFNSENSNFEWHILIFLQFLKLEKVFFWKFDEETLSSHSKSNI